MVTRYLEAAGLTPYLQALGFHAIGYGCTTCIGNSGPILESVHNAIADNDLVVAAVLSGNRNFEGRVHAAAKANYLASPPLVVAYALAGTVDFDPQAEPLGYDALGDPVYLRDVWPSQTEVRTAMQEALSPELFETAYDAVSLWVARPGPALAVPEGELYAWDAASTYVQEPPFFADLTHRGAAGSRHHRCTRAGDARRFRNHGPHLAGRLHPRERPRRPPFDRAGRRTQRLQLLRCPARQSRRS